MRDADIARDPARVLRRPWLKTRTHDIRRGKYRLHLYEQPGRWMTDDALGRLTETLRDIGAGAMDDVPTYGVFSGHRSAFTNRVIGVVRLKATGEPVAFTALVYLPILFHGRVEPVVHLGLTMIKKTYRGQRLQSPLFEKLIYMCFYNQLKGQLILTNIAASPAGIGAVSDYFQDAYPHYRGTTRRSLFHLEVAERILATYRHEFGCAESARFDPDTFVVRGSNAPEEGGAWQFIREDPVSKHREKACNTFCQERLRFSEGDELFQVARVDILSGTLGLIKRLGARRRAARLAESAHQPVMEHR